ncbi:2TM domain-containing protein [Dokdonia ponticola]|uniref:2TM domain-containing protein n=1 Tax=Dokdonia ponticola TaxID=2041041 RepID=A0ABV9HR09_9FLAO
MEDTNEKKLERARKQVGREKAWYSHLFAYIVFCTVEQLFYAGIFDDKIFTSHVPFWVRIITPTVWGIGVFIHWLYVFKAVRFNSFYKNWEKRKIDEYMEKEEDEFMSNIWKEK